MFTVEEICKTGLQLAMVGDKPSEDDFALSIRTLQSILSKWAAVEDVHLWNISDSTLAIPRGDVVLHNSVYYQCYNPHQSTADDEPGVGNNWENYWKPCREITTPLTWATGLDYVNQRSLSDLRSYPFEDIYAIRILHQGQFSPVEKISMLEYKQLDAQELGLPTHVWVEKTNTGISLHLFPLNDQEEVTLHFYAIARPESVDPAAPMPMPDYWAAALYYALAVELGFMYNIGIERINLLGQKAVFEFNKAFRTNQSEVDKCFVKPCY